MLQNHESFLYNLFWDISLGFTQHTKVKVTRLTTAEIQLINTKSESMKKNKKLHYSPDN